MEYLKERVLILDCFHSHDPQWSPTLTENDNQRALIEAHHSTPQNQQHFGKSRYLYVALYILYIGLSLTHQIPAACQTWNKHSASSRVRQKVITFTSLSRSQNGWIWCGETSQQRVLAALSTSAVISPSSSLTAAVDKQLRSPGPQKWGRGMSIKALSAIFKKNKNNGCASRRSFRFFQRELMAVLHRCLTTDQQKSWLKLCYVLNYS